VTAESEAERAPKSALVQAVERAGLECGGSCPGRGAERVRRRVCLASAMEATGEDGEITI
jgi:hypothetical protein